MKNLQNLGKALSKAEQKTINGGKPSLSCFGKKVGDSCNNGGTCVSSNEFTGGSSDNPYLICQLSGFFQS